MGATKNTTENETCAQPSVKLHRHISILPNDYANLVNLPTLNGVTLLGDLKSTELNLLSSAKEDYEDTSLEDAQAQDGYLVVLLPNSTPKCVSLSYIRSALDVEGGFLTVDEFNPDAPVGSYQFVVKK